MQKCDKSVPGEGYGKHNTSLGVSTVDWKCHCRLALSVSEELPLKTPQPSVKAHAGEQSSWLTRNT